MCNTALDCLKGSSLRDSEGGGLDMDDSHDVNQATIPNYNDENLRVKFLCSFSGSILPRPQDGKLRYVGGETRIVSVPHDIGYDDLMARMRELYEDAAILKYQQPDEDLDALVSVVNDEDVRNMMEEYDKLGSGDGFTRLRIFLFSYPDQDLSPHYLDGYERDNERRYVDALNSLSESPEYRRHQYIGSPVTTLLDDFPVADQFNSINLDGGVYGQRNFDVTIPQYYLRPLVVPNVASGHQSVAGALRYNEETSWSPSYYSPRYAGPNDPRAVPEVPHSPSSARYILPFAEVPDNGIDRAPDEYRRPEVNHQGQYAHQAQYSDNFVRLPPDQGGFPGNILQRPNGYDGHSICESCRMVLRRNQSARDFNRLHEEHPHMVQSSMSNGFPQAGDSCVECLRFQEAASLNADSKLQHGGNAEQIDPRSHYGETHASERWRHMCLHDQLNSRAHDPRAHMSGEGKVNDHCVIDGRQIGFPHGHNGLSDRHHMHMSHMHPNDRHCIPSGSGHELAQEVYLGQAMAPGSIHVPFEEREAAHANLPFMYGLDDSHKQSHAQLPSHDVWQNVPTPVHVHFTSESNHQQRHEMDLPGSQRRTVEDNSRSSAGIEQNPQIGSSQRRMESDGHGTTQLDHAHNDAPNQHHGVLSEETHNFLSRDSDQNQSQTSDGASLESLLESMRLPETFSKSVCSSTVRKGSEPRSDTGDNGSEPRVETGGNNSGPRFNTGGNGVLSLKEESLHGDWSIDWGQPEDSDWKTIHDELESVTSNAESVTGSARLSSPNGTSPAEGRKRAADLDEEAGIALEVNSVAEFVASAKQSKRESVEVFKVGALEDDHAVPVADSTMNNSHAGERDAKNVDGNSETGSDDENHSDSKIEPTTAEEEAVARGLQTIRNEDLEEIRELGSGTYGSVYHGKWRGSDVAIKRIKASCFAGRPSERERLIADFWKEALILSSVHHPNVVSFYGVVRDGTDGSLATVTEFMVNGSLKQYLRKKDRTIDRRKRLILAMDAAFGMEYLHEKNIVHFDLKCENLLVNMRDPHRPVCKIGDLGLSKVKQRTLVSGGVRGTLPWMAPELLRGKSNMVTEKIDVYSFGIVMWELITGDEPYADMHGASIIGGIVNNTLRPQIPTWCDPEWKSLMENCWSDDPAERPSFSEISQRLRHMAAAMNLK